MSVFENIVGSIQLSFFNLPLIQDEESYFPEFIKQKFDDYILYYEENIRHNTDFAGLFSSNKKDLVINKIVGISELLVRSINLYFSGNIKDSYSAFEKAMELSYFDKIKPVVAFEVGTLFYRCRKDNGSFYRKKDLFHVGFENRHLVQSTRYSIHGLPALYVGDSSYVCWEEFDRYPIERLWFTLLENQKQLNIISIERIEDLLLEVKDFTEKDKLIHLLRYFILYPLVLSCTVKVRHMDGVFKPEYIIPQFLMQYISQKEDIDGIKYISTKLDYSNLNNVGAYNYVFPVKNVKNAGYCERLKETFYLTEPTSIMLENTLFNPEYTGVVFLDNDDYVPEMTISLIKGDSRDYHKTSFGRIESKLKDERRKLNMLDL
jgi:hypothetical protein